MNDNEKKWIDEHAADGERADAEAEVIEDHDSMVETTVDRHIISEMDR